jgi:hypothetical protein
MIYDALTVAAWVVVAGFAAVALLIVTPFALAMLLAAPFAILEAIAGAAKRRKKLVD